MKRIVLVAVILLVFSISAQAQMNNGMMGEQKGQAGPGMMPCMQEHMPMMKHMMGHGMMMQDLVQTMKKMIEVQRKIVEGVKPAEKKALVKELSGMREKMDKMTADMKNMMSQGMMMQGVMGATASAGPKKTQEKSEAGVIAKVDLESTNGTVRFKVTLETHAVELDGYKFDEIVALRAGGKEYKARVKSQEGSGHHRSAVIEFDNPKAEELELIIKDVAGVKERVFKF